MTISYRLTPELRSQLKKPIGRLIRGPFDKTIQTLKEIVREEEPPKIISVGDTVSKNIAKNNITSDISIIDNKVMRKTIDPITLWTDRTFYVTNPPGTITEEALATIQEALKTEYPVKIVVDGEEDLLTLPGVWYAPINSFVVYGQPLEGIVIVQVTKQKKEEIEKILKTMKDFEKLNK